MLASTVDRHNEYAELSAKTQPLALLLAVNLALPDVRPPELIPILKTKSNMIFNPWLPHRQKVATSFLLNPCMNLQPNHSLIFVLKLRWNIMLSLLSLLVSLFVSLLILIIVTGLL